MKAVISTLLLLLSLAACISLTWTLYQKSAPFATAFDGVIFMLMALLYCTPIALVCSFIRYRLDKNK
jgi:hypothetical protein